MQVTPTNRKNISACIAHENSVLVSLVIGKLQGAADEPVGPEWSSQDCPLEWGGFVYVCKAQFIF